ncbi:hypothetical protein AAFC00_002374 [Neodothiora populina]|uniref:Amino acid permease/ SLC12A domain-containing protein n=1 Tax=Neodothiora populina TaxID=2781224 RepID=A0ABR3PH92_9PEZI
MSVDVAASTNMESQDKKTPYSNEKTSPSLDIQEGHSSDIVDFKEEPEKELPRTFSPRQIQVINVGGTLGSGLFIVTGKALASGGPGSVIVGYALVCSAVFAVLQVVGEMTIAFPTSGNFIDYADRFVDPALAFAAGFAEWLGWTAVIGSEAVMFNTVVNYWADGAVPTAALYTIFLVFLAVLMFLPNQWFAWFEYITSILKIIGLLVIIFFCFAVILGAGANGQGHRYTGETWRELPVFKNGFSGFSSCMLYAIWAIGDNVMPGLTIGEGKTPRFSMGRAVKIVPFRVSVVYLIPCTLVSFIVRSDDDRLFGGKGAAASPFVIAANMAGVGGLGDFLNVIIMLGLTAIAAESIYISSRIARAMSHQRIVPRYMAKVNSWGQPMFAIGLTVVVGVILTYINLSATGVTVFTWLVSITSAAYFMVWMIIVISSVRFRAALKAQNDPLFEELYAWRMTGWPFTPIYLMAMCILLLIACIYSGLYSVGSTSISVYAFFEYMIGVLLILASYIGYKLVCRTKLRDLKTVDLQTGRRVISEGELTLLRTYYATPPWRRALSYFQIW